MPCAEHLPAARHAFPERLDLQRAAAQRRGVSTHMKLRFNPKPERDILVAVLVVEVVVAQTGGVMAADIAF